MPVSDMYMLIYLKYARAYALLKKAFCYAQKGQICLKICGHYGPKPSTYDTYQQVPSTKGMFIKRAMVKGGYTP